MTKPWNPTTNDLVFTGPSTLHSLSKKIKNKCWQNYLISIGELQREAHYALPEKFYLFPVFNNPLIKSGRNCLKRLDFGNPTHKITQIADFFHSKAQLSPLVDINTKFVTEITRLQLDRILSAIEAGRTTLIRIQIACKKMKGCRAFYNIFRTRPNDRGNPPKHETKWHTLLGAHHSYLSDFGTMLGNCILAVNTITPLNGYSVQF